MARHRVPSCPVLPSASPPPLPLPEDVLFDLETTFTPGAFVTDLGLGSPGRGTPFLPRGLLSPPQNLLSPEVLDWLWQGERDPDLLVWGWPGSPNLPRLLGGQMETGCVVLCPAPF